MYPLTSGSFEDIVPKIIAKVPFNPWLYPSTIRLTTTYHELSNGAPSYRFGSASIVVPINNIRTTAQIRISYLEGRPMSEVVRRPKQSQILNNPTTNKDLTSVSSSKYFNYSKSPGKHVKETVYTRVTVAASGQISL